MRGSEDPPVEFVESGELPDGSRYEVMKTGYCSFMISRYVDDRCVWGQVFSRQDEPLKMVAGTVAKMHANPSGFERWYLADEAWRSRNPPTDQTTAAAV